MSKASPPRPSVFAGEQQFAIVASKFNDDYVQGLIEHATNELRSKSPRANILLYRVPGAFEIPVMVGKIAARKEVHAILSIGVILKGKTDHATHLARSVTCALQRIAVDSGVPVINCVLSFDDETQARERCLAKEINRGREAADAAIEIAAVMADLDGNS